MSEKSSVFEETYTNYLARIGELAFAVIAARHGAEMIGDELIIPFFGRPHRTSSGGIFEPSGSRPNFSVFIAVQ